jgi:hypothetical protein
MWEPQHLTTLWAFTACYRDNFVLLFTLRDPGAGHQTGSEASLCPVEQAANLLLWTVGEFILFSIIKHQHLRKTGKSPYTYTRGV